MPMNRLFEIVYLLIERKRMTTRDLAAHFEVSVRTILRDIDALSAAGIPIYTARGRNGGVGILETYILNKTLISPEDRDRILFSLQALSATGMDPQGLPDRLRSFFQIPEPNWIEVDFSHWGWGNESDRRKFDTLKDAILQRHPIAFAYSGTYAETHHRVAYPLKLAFKTRAWYLQAFAPDRDDYRTFKITRMQSLQSLPETFPANAFIPPPLDPPMPSPMAMAALTLRVSPSIAYRIYDEFHIASLLRDPDGSYRLTTYLPDDAGLCDYLLSFGPGLEVLTPERIRQALRMRAAEIFAKYGNHDALLSGLPCYDDPVLQPNPEPNPLPAHPPNDPKGSDSMEANAKFCQSCGMPMNAPDARYGTQADGTPSEDYCSYCYDKGNFTSDCTLQEMIDFCVPHMTQGNPGMSESDARNMMQGFMPQLKRWKAN